MIGRVCASMIDLTNRFGETPPRKYVQPHIRIEELMPVSQLRVQILRNSASRRAISVIGMPDIPNTGSGVDPVALWQGPGDWHVYSQSLDARALEAWGQNLSSESPFVLTEMSFANVVFELSGKLSVDILLRDCTLDLLGGAISPVQCARTQYAQTSVLIHRVQQVDVWRLFVERSVSQYVWEWLLDSASFASMA